MSTSTLEHARHKEIMGALFDANRLLVKIVERLERNEEKLDTVLEQQLLRPPPTGG